MNRTKSLVMGLVLVAAVVALEEWRLAGMRSRVGQLENDLASAEAAIPPPPRPEPSGEDPGEMLRRSQSHRVGEANQENSTTAAASPEEKTPSSVPVSPVEPAAAPAPEPEPVATAPEPVAKQVRSPANQSLRNTVVKLYAGLIEKFGFNNVEAGYFIDLLVEDVLIRQQLAADLTAAQTDEERAEVQRRGEQSGADIARRMRTFLANDGDFANFQEYRRLVEQAATQR